MKTLTIRSCSLYRGRGLYFGLSGIEVNLCRSAHGLGPTSPYGASVGGAFAGVTRRDGFVHSPRRHF